MFKKEDRKIARKKRHLRVRKKVNGTPERPRLNVCRTLSHIHAQIIDDINGHTLVAASTVEPAIKGQISHGGNVAAAQVVGKIIAERAIAKGITKVVFDRGGNAYHGRIKAFAEAAREGGLEF